MYGESLKWGEGVAGVVGSAGLSTSRSHVTTSHGAIENRRGKFNSTYLIGV